MFLIKTDKQKSKWYIYYIELYSEKCTKIRWLILILLRKVELHDKNYDSVEQRW